LLPVLLLIIRNDGIAIRNCTPCLFVPDFSHSLAIVCRLAILILMPVCQDCNQIKLIFPAFRWCLLSGGEEAVAV
jgi:hypothetical protein